jgi:hypothetical protein
MSKGGDAPAAPDPYAVSQAQTDSNIATAERQSALNSPDTYNPYGSTTYGRDASGAPTSAVTSLTPELQYLLGGQEATGAGLTGISGELMNNLNTGGINAPTANDVGNQAYQSMTSYLRPEFDQQHTQLEQQLDSRGLPIGSEARTAAEGAQQRNQNQALGQAAAQAQVQGANEQNTLFGQAVQQNQIPYQNLVAMLSANPTSSLLSRSTTPTSPTSQIAPTNVSGNVYQSYNDQMAAYNQQQQQGAGLAQGAASLAMLAMLSDENTKENREPADGESILLKFRSLPVDNYDYKQEAQEKYGVPESRVGPMAQDWSKNFGGDGHTIDLGDMMGHMLAAIKALETRTHAAGRNE